MVARAVDKRAILILSILLGIALALRCAGISRESLWIDESFTWGFASGSFARAWHGEPTNPQLYFVLIHLWAGLFGTSEAALRGMSVVPSLLSVWLVYRLAGKLLSRTIAYMAAGYQAIAAFQIYFAQEARCYSLLVCFLLLAALNLWNALTRDSGRRRLGDWAAYTLFATLACYTHFVAVFFLAGHGLFVLFYRRKQVFLAGASIGTALILFAPWVVTMLDTASGPGQIRRYRALKFPQAYFSMMFGDSLMPMDERAVQHIREVLPANWWIVAAVPLSVAVLVPFCWLARKRWGDPMLFVLFMAVAPLVLAFLVSFKVRFFDRRYMIPASPFVYAAMAAAVWEIAVRSRERGMRDWKTHAGWAATGVYGVLLLISLYHYYFVPRYGKEQWREAISYIEASASPNEKDLLVLDPDYLLECYRYYGKRDLPVWQVTLEAGREMARSPSMMESRLHGFHRVWLVRSHSENDDALSALRAASRQQNYRVFPKANIIEVYSFSVGEAY